MTKDLEKQIGEVREAGEAGEQAKQVEQLETYDPIHKDEEFIINDISFLDPQLIKEMPVETAANLIVKTANFREDKLDSHPIQIARRQNLPNYEEYKEILRIVSANPEYSETTGYSMSALEHDTAILKDQLDGAKVPFAEEITDSSRVLSFDIDDLVEKIDPLNNQVKKIDHPVFQAETFMPWALECLDGTKKFTHILVDSPLLPDSDQEVLQKLEQKGVRMLEALKQSRSHQIITNLGFELYPAIHQYRTANNALQTLALYTRKSAEVKAEDPSLSQAEPEIKQEI